MTVAARYAFRAATVMERFSEPSAILTNAIQDRGVLRKRGRRQNLSESCSGAAQRPGRQEGGGGQLPSAARARRRGVAQWDFQRVSGRGEKSVRRPYRA